jgi:hypothetical protein
MKTGSPILLQIIQIGLTGFINVFLLMGNYDIFFQNLKSNLRQIEYITIKC